METSSGLFWFQGQFLQPQHLQFLEHSQEEMVWSRCGQARPYYWGVQKLEISREALANEQLSLSSFQAVLPDGTAVAYPGNAVLAPRTVDKKILHPDRALPIHIGVKRWDANNGNVAVVPRDASPASVQQRWIAHQDPDLQPDTHIQNAPAGNIHRKKLVLRLFFEHEAAQMAGYETLEIARLLRRDEQIKLAEDFAPPSLFMGASQALVALLEDVKDSVTSRAMQLQDYKIHGEQRSRDFDPQYLIFIMALQTLNRYVQPLLHFAETPAVSPWATYGLLRQFISDLCVFSRALSPTGRRSDGSLMLPPYDHRDCYPCFRNAKDLITQLIEGLGTSIEFLVRLEQLDLLLQAELPERIFKHTNHYWLIVQTASEDPELIENMLRTAKLSAPPTMSAILVQAISGIGLTPYNMPPAGLPKKSGNYYLQIDHQSSDWSEVETSRGICLFWEGKPEDVEVYFAVVRAA